MAATGRWSLHLRLPDCHMDDLQYGPMPGSLMHGQGQPRGDSCIQWQLLSSPVTVPQCRCKSCRTLTSASCSTRNCAKQRWGLLPHFLWCLQMADPLSWADRGLRQLQNFPCCASALKCGPNEYVYVLNCPPCRCDAAGQKVIIWYFRKRMNLHCLAQPDLSLLLRS